MYDSNVRTYALERKLRYTSVLSDVLAARQVTGSLSTPVSPLMPVHDTIWYEVHHGGEPTYSHQRRATQNYRYMHRRVSQAELQADTGRSKVLDSHDPAAPPLEAATTYPHAPVNTGGHQRT